MTPAARRIATAAKLDALRHAAAIGASRERCIPAAVDRLVPLLVAEPPVRETASLVRPFLLPPDPTPRAGEAAE